MPELPEVEIVKSDLAGYFAKFPVIERIELRRKDLREPFPVKKLKALHGAIVTKVLRRAKYILIETDRGTLISHLGMTGSWRPVDLGNERIHDHVYLHLGQALGSPQGLQLRLGYCDPRRFGILDVAGRDWAKNKRLSKLGPEPLDPDLDVELLWRNIRRRQGSIKAVLMNQEILVGVGNIYASEALFRAGLRPTRKASGIKLDEFFLLLRQMVGLLLEAITKGGSTISDFVHGAGEGQFQDSHSVYDRAGMDCRVCGHQIKSKTVAGRSTFWCPSCQR